MQSETRLDSRRLTDLVGARLLRLRLTLLHPPEVCRHHQLRAEVLEDPPEFDGVKAGGDSERVLGVEGPHLPPHLPTLQESHHEELSRGLGGRRGVVAHHSLPTGHVRAGYVDHQPVQEEGASLQHHQAVPPASQHRPAHLGLLLSD